MAAFVAPIRVNEFGLKISAVGSRGLALNRARQGLLVVLAAVLLVSGAVSAKAFTLVTVTVTLSPTSGLPTAPFTARATFAANCTNAFDRYFYFYWDSTANSPFWSAIRIPCDPKTSKYDTGPSPATTPPAGQNKIGSHKVIVVMKDGSNVTQGVGSHAYTIVWGKPYVTISPTSGIPTAKFTVRGKFDWTGPCPGTRVPSSITFKFNWYKVSTTRIPLWTKTVSTCSGGIVDTGTSPAFVPPSPLNYPSTFVVQVAVYDSSGSPFGKAYGAPYTNTTLYTVLTAPSPSPNASPSAAQCGTAGQAACPTPSSTPCVVQSAALMRPGSPGGADTVVLLALAALGALPIGGVAMVCSPGLWSRRSRWSWLAALLALSLVLLSAEACAAPNQVAQGTPSQAETSPSPSPSPTPSC